MTHTHQFIQIDTISKPSEVSHRSNFGIKAGCILCGEIRHLWPDGTVEVVIKGQQKETQNGNTKD